MKYKTAKQISNNNQNWNNYELHLYQYEHKPQSKRTFRDYEKDAYPQSRINRETSLYLLWFVSVMTNLRLFIQNTEQTSQRTHKILWCVDR